MGAERRRAPAPDQRRYVWCGVAAILLVCASWWQGSHTPLPKTAGGEACDARCAAPTNGTLAATLTDAAAAAQRTCAERLYRCGDATLISAGKSTSDSGAPDYSSLKSFLGDDAAVLARSSGEEPAPPRHRAGVASMAWRTTRRFSTNAP